jgi:seryl-tRNA synthetase
MRWWRACRLDEERRALIAEGDALKARRNTVSQEVGGAEARW